jgi:DNA-binding SARP family transcriptional activator/WD40 repeat protein
VIVVTIDVRLLGPTEVGVDGTLSPRDRVILSALCLRPGESVPADVLADALWGEAPPKSWGKVVQGSVMRLRRIFGAAAIETTAAGYRMVLPQGHLDTVEFEALVSRGRSFLAVHEPQRAATTFTQALSLWRGPPFPELEDWDRARSEGARLLDIRRTVEEDLVEALLAAGRAVEAATMARPLVAHEPFRERRWALLATALYRTGRQGEALDVLRRASATTRDELGLDPGPELAALELRILQQDPSLLDVPNRIGGASATCPYRGLRPYDAQDADLFHGRAGVVAEAVRRLEEFPLLLVVGPSGSGKSSLVRAGILPRMVRMGHAASVCAPGPDPAASLAAALAALPDDGLLVVDQLEELYANDVPREAARAFLDRLAAIVGAGTRVVVTLRADHLGWLAESPALSRAAEGGLMLLTPLTDDELREAIEGPARLVGLVLEPGLVDLLVRDVAGAAGGLPLLSHALAETWEQREGSVLTVDGYRATGGIRSAVAKSAERLYDSLGPEDRDTLRSVLQRLVTPTPAGEPMAARVPTRVFAGSPEAPRLLDLLVRSRLVTTSHDSATIAHEALVRAWPRLRAWLDEDVEGQRILAHLQVAAETWDALGRPDDELYRGARLAAAREWQQRARPVLAPVEGAFLASAGAHADAERLDRERAHAHQVRRNRQLRGTLAAAILLLAVALVAGTLAGLNGRAAQLEAIRAAGEAGRADTAAVEAIGARLAATALGESNPDLALLLARQAVALAENPTTQGALLSGLMNIEGLVGLAQARRGPHPLSADHAFTPDGRVLLHMNARWELHLLDTATGISRFGPLADTSWGYPTWRFNWAGFPSGFVEGGRVAMLSHARPATPPGPAAPNRPVGLVPIDVATGEPAGPRQRVPGAVMVLGADVVHGDALRISPDGRMLVSLLDASVRIWRRSGQRWVGPRSVPIPGLSRDEAEPVSLVGASFSSAGDRAAIVFERVTAPALREPGGVVVDLGAARLLSPSYVGDRRRGLAHMAISPDGTRVLVGGSEGPVQVRRVGDDQVLHAIPGQSPATVVAWSADGDRVAVGRLDGTSEVYSLDPLQRVMTGPGSDRVSALAFVGEHGLLRESITGSIARYDLDVLSPIAEKATTAPIHAVATAPGLVAQGEDGGWVTIRDGRTLRQIGPKLRVGPDGAGGPTPAPAARRITALALAPDGSVVIAGDRLGHLRMWSLPERALLWSRDDVPAAWLAISNDGRYLATAGNTFRGGLPEGDPVTSAFTVWDLATRSVHLSEGFSEPQPAYDQDSREVPRPQAVAFSPDGNWVALAHLDSLMVYDIALGRRTWLKSTQETFPSSISFSPDSRRLLATTADYLREWDAATGELQSRGFVPGLREATRMAYSDDGRWLVISHPRSLTVLDARTLRVVLPTLTLPTEAPTDAFAVAAGEGHRMIIGTRSVLASIDMDPERWKAAACRVAGRTLTDDEWGRFLPDLPFAPACA